MTHPPVTLEQLVAFLYVRPLAERSKVADWTPNSAQAEAAFGVSRSTINRALDRLVEIGLVRRLAEGTDDVNTYESAFPSYEGAIGVLQQKGFNRGEFIAWGTLVDGVLYEVRAEPKQPGLFGVWLGDRNLAMARVEGDQVYSVGVMTAQALPVSKVVDAFRVEWQRRTRGKA